MNDKLLGPLGILLMIVLLFRELDEVLKPL